MTQKLCNSLVVKIDELESIKQENSSNDDDSRRIKSEIIEDTEQEELHVDIEEASPKSRSEIEEESDSERLELTSPALINEHSEGAQSRCSRSDSDIKVRTRIILFIII